MTGQVLTDAEIERLAETGRRASLMSPGYIPYARAVEAAVLAKVQHRIDDVIRSRCGASVTEREARKRERAAFYHGARAERTWRLASRTDEADGEKIRADCDRRYPPPTVTRPRTVTLSDGDTVRLNGLGHWTIQTPGERGSISQAGVPYNFAKTPADARLLADLVERPTEDVPE